MKEELKTTEQAPVGIAETNEELITLTKSQLEGIMADLDSLKKSQTSVKPKRSTERVATLRFHDDKPVVWYGEVKEVWNSERHKNIAYLDFKVEGNNKPINVEYLKFLNSDNKVNVKIKSQSVEEITQSEGVMTTRNPDQAKIATKNWESREMDAEIITRIYTVTVEVMEGPHSGEVYTVPAKSLNN